MNLNGAYWKLWHDVSGRFLAALLIVAVPTLGFLSLNHGVIAEMWSTTLPLLLLFIGIVLSVGPPFCGESMEAFSLTFSLPWTREQWLWAKVRMSMLLIAILLLFVFVAGLLAVRVRVYNPHASLWYQAAPTLWYPEGAGRSTPALSRVIDALLAGAVGVSLGTLSSMYSRNMLNAAVGASIAAYIVAMTRIATMPLNPQSHGILPPNADLVGAFFVVGLAALLATSRLRHTDY